MQDDDSKLERARRKTRKERRAEKDKPKDPKNSIAQEGPEVGRARD